MEKITTFIGNYTEVIIDKEERMARQEEMSRFRSARLAAGNGPEAIQSVGRFNDNSHPYP